MKRMLVYIAGPMAIGYIDGLIQSVEAIVGLWSKGHIAYSPYSMLPVSLRKAPSVPGGPGTEEYEKMMEYDLTFIRCFADAVFRLNGESSGADREVALSNELGKPVYYSLDQVPEYIGG